MLRLLLPVLVLTMSAAPARAQRVLVLPVGGDVDASMATTLGRAVETAVSDALPGAEVMTSASLETSIEVSRLQDCALDEAVGACISEIADAANAEVVVRPHLGRLGDEYIFTLTMTGGVSARLLAQGQRRAPVARPTTLLDVIPTLVQATAVDAGLVRERRDGSGTAIAVAVGGAIGAGAGVALLVLRAVAEGEYSKGNLEREQASNFENLQQPALLIGVVIVVVGGIAATGGTAAAVWPLLRE